MESSSHDLQKILRDLSESPFRHERYNAAMKLGQLSENDEEIARALAAAVALDEDVDVRSAAMQALHSPVHQAFLKDRPEFVREAVKSAAENKEREERRDEEKTVFEFLRRHRRERVHYLVLMGGFFVACIPIYMGVVQGWMSPARLRLWQFVVIAFAVLIGYLSWCNRRCPACDSWLAGFTYGINPILSPEFVRCPHCGRRLL